MNCSIKKDGSCGSYNAGRVDYLVNSSGTHKFRVLVRTTRNYGDPLLKDDVFVIDPWGRIQLGCDQVHASVPTITYSPAVIDEVQI